MNKTCYTVLLVLFVLPFFLSCSKTADSNDISQPPTPPPPAVVTLVNKLQHKWIFKSLMVYADSSLTGQSFPGPIGNGSYYFDFRSNGKLYTYMVGSYDTAEYLLRPDSILLIRQYYGGVLSTVTDTSSVRILTDNSLIFAHRNSVGDYGRFSFTR